MARRGLMEQDLSKLDVTKLHPLLPEVISCQATINIGKHSVPIARLYCCYLIWYIGHVAHGKSTVVKATSGVQTVRFKNELERNITIKLGYANAKIYKCEDDRCPRPMCYKYVYHSLNATLLLMFDIFSLGSSEQGTIAEGAPVVPISAQLKNFTSPPNMIVIRSFDVNKPGSEVDEIRGGVAGGSILRGVLRVNQRIEVRPGIVMKDESGNIKCTPIYSRIVSLYAEQNELQFAVPGGLIVGSLPDVYVELEINFFLLRRLLGVRTKGTEKAGKVSKLTKGEVLMLNIGSMSTGARVVAVKNDLAKLQLTAPVCTSKGEKVALSRRVEKHWRLIGWGQIQGGSTLDVPACPL
ncbi:hypothetical protein PR202_gb00530 [Eleusine coracana subsp. coracana]|uniref:Initiation factor eIF2 gamma C-terminal domain-containing protein n=1 Tax=Eleusine coracana subsp. coracana TaxID=191504 RepID=A0AAV5DUB3_ELECO|nr:hypothetical protein PR202_gb00530 [Eleusine coracana subsp. coracana]